MASVIGAIFFVGVGSRFNRVGDKKVTQEKIVLP